MIQCRLITKTEFHEAMDRRKAAMEAWTERHSDDWTPARRDLHRTFIPPGTMWFCPWYHDPEADGAAERALANIRRIETDPTFKTFLSIHYWRDWATKRPPIAVIGPNGDEWVVDSKSSNGTGWTVTGEAPAIVCNPSIWLRQGKPDSYHGWLGQSGASPGWFSNPV